MSAVEIVMPKLSDTMEEGTILKWLKQVGDAVARGEVLAEVETDKADMELEASAAGVLREIKVQEGENAAVGAVIALVDENAAGDGEPAKRGPALPSEKKDDKAAAPAAQSRQRSAPAAAADTRKASPGARKLASERGVDLRMVQGSGPGGRIVTDDVDTAAKQETPRYHRHNVTVIPPRPASARSRGVAKSSPRTRRGSAGMMLSPPATIRPPHPSWSVRSFRACGNRSRGA
jgi:pyruvate dehydrogenase E2 component (dihydrolipoamide acetyltransferase)